MTADPPVRPTRRAICSIGTPLSALRTPSPPAEPTGRHAMAALVDAVDIAAVLAEIGFPAP